MDYECVFALFYFLDRRTRLIYWEKTALCCVDFCTPWV